MAAVLAIAGVSLFCGRASGSPVTLGAATSYGVLVGPNSTFNDNGSFNLTGNLAFGKSDTISGGGSGNTPNEVYGNVYEDTGVTSNLTNNYLTGTVYQSYSLSTAVSAINAAAASATALSATSGFATTYQNTALSVSSSTITLNAVTSLSENVLDITSLSLSNGTLTLNDNGISGAKFIINVTGAFSVTGSSKIQVTGGGTGADVIFNIENTGTAVSLTGNSSSAVVGTILAPQRSVNLSGGGTLSGAIYAATSGSGYTLSAQSTGYNITSLGYIARTVSAPEPPPLAVFGVGLSSLIAFGRRRRHSDAELRAELVRRLSLGLDDPIC